MPIVVVLRQEKKDNCLAALKHLVGSRKLLEVGITVNGDLPSEFSNIILAERVMSNLVSRLLHLQRL